MAADRVSPRRCRLAAPGDRLVPAIYTCRVRHVRSEPLRHAFSYRTWMWLVDLDHLPELPWLLRPLASFQARDHLGRA